MKDPRYPIGPFEYRSGVADADVAEMIEQIGATPERLRAAVSGLSDAQLDTPYREGGWTLRQVAHHVPDSHLNAFIRLKLALTEDAPTIKPYDESKWARLNDVRDTPVETSLVLLESLHARWMTLLRALTPADRKRVFVHPDHGAVTVDWLVQMYAWHGRHHVGHITSLRDQRGW